MTRTGCGAGQSVMGPFYCPGGRHRLYRSLILR
ncbi:neutral zinc metallopeptidase, partial [Salmonella enterica]